VATLAAAPRAGGVRGRGEELDPGGAEGLGLPAGGQAEVEADDRGALGHEGRELGVVGQE
jgi:hypothetical protein